MSNVCGRCFNLVNTSSLFPNDGIKRNGREAQRYKDGCYKVKSTAGNRFSGNRDPDRGPPRAAISRERGSL